ncbi:type II secretion system protein [Paenibacillus glufosinatiresistens]|uniref:type II secretion system protein n=1 Tax=Paenibacillus glufosinatiresistens TaxID=3070657 RepID=UPI00286DA1F1|nr:type II secretion system protein [Paenibacillus sp. YX.27]
MLKEAIRKRLSKEEGQKGFTLIELLAVIVILGIIAVIAIPLIGNVISNTKDNADVATARQVYDAARLYVTGEKGGDFKSAGDIKLTDLQSKGYLDKPLTLPSSKVEITEAIIHFNSQGQLDNKTTTGADAITFTPATGSAIKYSAKQVLSAKK